MTMMMMKETNSSGTCVIVSARVFLMVLTKEEMPVKLIVVAYQHVLRANCLMTIISGVTTNLEAPMTKRDMPGRNIRKRLCI